MNFPNLVITNVTYLATAFRAAQEFIVPHRIYGHGEERVKTVEEALEVVFRQLNAVDGNELISEHAFLCEHPGLRSMSVGDCVTFRGPGGWRKEFVCEGCGWTEISREDVEWLRRCVRFGDFLSFAAAKADMEAHNKPAPQRWECPACGKTYATYAQAKCCREIPVPAKEVA